jgi:hypothetical protein
MMKIYPEKRPSTTQEALKILKEFQSQVVKQQFVRSLHTWLPVSNEWPLLQEEAMRQEGTLRDELFKLVEYWQDALPE